MPGNYWKDRPGSRSTTALADIDEGNRPHGSASDIAKDTGCNNAGAPSPLPVTAIPYTGFTVPSAADARYVLADIKRVTRSA